MGDGSRDARVGDACRPANPAPRPLRSERAVVPSTPGRFGLCSTTGTRRGLRDQRQQSVAAAHLWLWTSRPCLSLTIVATGLMSAYLREGVESGSRLISRHHLGLPAALSQLSALEAAGRGDEVT